MRIFGMMLKHAQKTIVQSPQALALVTGLAWEVVINKIISGVKIKDIKFAGMKETSQREFFQRIFNYPIDETTLSTKQKKALQNIEQFLLAGSRDVKAKQQQKQFDEIIANAKKPKSSPNSEK